MRRAFGLKGELVVQPTTNEPGAVFAPGRRVFASGVGSADSGTGEATLAGGTMSGAHVIQRSRPFKDAWLVKLEGVDDKTGADRWRGAWFEVPQEELSPPDENEVYLHELSGMRVCDGPHGDLGVVAGWYELPQGLVLEVRGPAWRADVPFNEAFVTKVDRVARTIAVHLPEGLLEPAAQAAQAAPRAPATQVAPRT